MSLSTETTNAGPRTLAEHRARIKTMPTEGGRLAYVDEGVRDAPAILLVHGMPTSSWLYRHIIPELTQSGFRVIAPDLLGFGASDKPADPTQYTLSRQAVRLLALMKGLGLTTWTQVCHDLGGFWTWEIVDREPEHIERLVILNTSAYHIRPPLSVSMMGGPFGIPALGMMRNSILGPTMLGSFFKSFVAYPQRLTKSVIEGYWQPFHEGTTHAFRQFASSFDFSFAQLDRYQAAIKQLTAPAMIVWGKQDPILDYEKLPAQFARDLKIPPERVHILDDASHFLQEDQPLEVARRLSAFAQA